MILHSYDFLIIVLLIHWLPHSSFDFTMESWQQSRVWSEFGSQLDGCGFLKGFLATGECRSDKSMCIYGIKLHRDIFDFDGDGCISANTKRKHAQVEVSMFCARPVLASFRATAEPR